MFTNCLPIFLSLFVIATSTPIRTVTETATEGRTHSTQVMPTTTSQPDEENVEDRRLARSQESHIGYYGCSRDESQCINGGNCVTVGEAGNICNCTKGYLGPFCAYPSVQVRNAVRSQPQVQVSFMECLKKNGKWSNFNAVKVFEKCGSAQNLCWYKEGGIKAVRALFWCLPNSLRLSITEEKPSGVSRAQMLSFFQKMERERQLPPGQPQPPPQGVPVASIQINIYNVQRPQNREPTITIKPLFTYWTTQSANEDKSPSQQPIAVDQPSERSESTQPSPVTTTTPINNIEISTVVANNDSMSSDETDSADYDYPNIYSLVGEGSDLTFLGNVVEATNEDYEEVMFDMVPYVNTSSNMRG